MLKPKRKPTKSSPLPKRKFKPLHDDLEMSKPKIEDSAFEYGDTNDLFEENIRETVEAGD